MNLTTAKEIKMEDNNGFWNKTEQTAKQTWGEIKNSAHSLKNKLSSHRRRAEEEMDFAETDFYEDNIYDEPEYWHSSHYYSSQQKSQQSRQKYHQP